MPILWGILCIHSGTAVDLPLEKLDPDLGARLLRNGLKQMGREPWLRSSLLDQEAQVPQANETGDRLGQLLPSLIYFVPRGVDDGAEDAGFVRHETEFRIESTSRD